MGDVPGHGGGSVATARDLPIACTLTPDRLQDRRAAWVALSEEALLRRTATADGVRLVFAPRPEVEDRLRELVALERECCGFARWDVRRHADEVVLDVRADGEGVPAVQALFGTAP